MAKMNLGRHIMLAVCLLCAHIASAQTYVKTPLTLDAQGDSMLSVMFAMPKMSYFVDDGFLHFAPAMGMNLANGTPGQPALPTMSTLVRLPKGRSEAFYKGMMGSAGKNADVFAAALERGCTQEQLDAMHAPIGVPIADKTPAEIAIAIIAELIDVRGKARKETAARVAEMLA